MMIGGEVAMWSDMYCPAPNCPDQPGPWAWMYPPSADDAFALSYSGLIWPRASAAGGAFWNYDPSIDTYGSEYAQMITDHNTRISARGVMSCKNGCARARSRGGMRGRCGAPHVTTRARGPSCVCDWNSACGVPYGQGPSLGMAVTLVNKAGENVQVKPATPCVSGYGPAVAKLAPGESYTATDDFIVTAIDGAGDPCAPPPRWRLVLPRITRSSWNAQTICGLAGPAGGCSRRRSG